MLLFQSLNKITVKVFEICDYHFLVEKKKFFSVGHGQ